ncbi:MAG: hypothetical protein EA350_17480 [Gemmatimonadales bacterium]|nr:MAG: hypothetical protein EA350_17480 [Gemmatimonadales bacterium]
MEGLFQLLILVFFIAASIFDAVGRNRKKKEQKDRMEEEEQAEQGTPQVRPGTRRPRPTARERESGGGTEGVRPRPMEGRRKAPTGEAEPRTTADQMIPEDFWAVLTGQAPAQRDEVQVEREPTPEPDRKSDREPAGISAYNPEPYVGIGTVSDAEDTATRRSSRWMEGLDQEEDRRAREVQQRAERQVPVTAAPVSFPRRADPMDEPWGELEDISSGEIGDGRGAVQGAVDLGAGGGSRRFGATESPYVKLVASGRQEDLKAAIVLREVLGAPVGSRPASEAPGGWRWEGP